MNEPKSQRNLLSCQSQLISLFCLLLITACYLKQACANPTLFGDNIVTQLFPNNSVTSLADNSVELPQIDNLLNTNAAVYRWSIDFKPEAIRIDFDNNAGDGTATYGANTSFTFTDIDPQLNGCSSGPEIVSINARTNNLSAPWVSSGSTFSAHEVKVVFGPPHWNA